MISTVYNFYGHHKGCFSSPKVTRDTLGMSRVTFWKFCHGLLSMSRVKIGKMCHGLLHGLLWGQNMSRVTRCVTGIFFSFCHGLPKRCHGEKKTMASNAFLGEYLGSYYLRWTPKGKSKDFVEISVVIVWLAVHHQLDRKSGRWAT